MGATSIFLNVNLEEKIFIAFCEVLHEIYSLYVDGLIKDIMGICSDKFRDKEDELVDIKLRSTFEAALDQLDTLGNVF